jgi:hypothetical protein
MERRSFETPLGEIWLWGLPEAFEDARPAIVILTGAFASASRMRRMPSLIPEAPVLVGDIPGNRCPQLALQTIGAYASAYSTAIRALERPVVLCGSSLGAVTALGVQAPNVFAMVALEPVMRTASATALWPILRERLGDEPDNPILREFLWNVFGIDERTHEPRDYFPILDRLSVPTIAMFGSDVATLPTLVSAEDRARFRAHPMVRTRTVSNVGHDIGDGAGSLIVEALREQYALHGGAV